MSEVFNFNHISEDLSEDDIKKFREIYKHYHRLSKCYEKMGKDCRRKEIFLTILKALLVFVGGGGVILSCVTLNPILLASLSGAGLIIGGYMRKVNLLRTIDRHKLAQKSYKKVLNKLREFMRGVHFDQHQFFGELMAVDDLVRERCQEVSDNADRWYHKEYENSF